jgi:hypothetical protein
VQLESSSCNGLRAELCGDLYCAARDSLIIFPLRLRLELIACCGRAVYRHGVGHAYAWPPDPHRAAVY